MIIKYFKHQLRALFKVSLILLFCSPVLAEDVVLFDVEISPEKHHSLRDSYIFSSSLQEGLQEQYGSVYYGPAVRAQLQVEYTKEECTPEQCSQNAVMNFGTNLMIEATVDVEEKGYIATMKIIDITDTTKSISKTDACLPCSKSQFIQRLKLFGAGKTAGVPVSADNKIRLQNACEVNITTDKYYPGNEVVIEGTTVLGKKISKNIGEAPRTEYLPTGEYQITITTGTKQGIKNFVCKAQANEQLKIAMLAKSQFFPNVEKNFVLYYEKIQGQDKTDGDITISDDGARFGLLSQFFPDSWETNIVQGFGINFGATSTTHLNTNFGEGESDGYFLGGFAYFNRYIAVGYQLFKISEPVDYGPVINENITISEFVAGIHYSIKNLFLSLNTYLRLDKNLPVSDSAISLGIGYKF